MLVSQIELLGDVVILNLPVGRASCKHQADINRVIDS